ncbi:MAG: hypothetical protein HWE39_22275 [Oceanospirillaceae bacterium]|nr:hypothetical protein [Oceanospirillaceae bacterium]
MSDLNIQRVLGLALLVVLPGCANLSTPAIPDDGIGLRGIVSPRGDRWALQHCYSRKLSLLSDPQQLLAPLYADRAPLPGLPVYAELEVSDDDEVRRMLLLGGDVAACRAELDGVELRAAGADPDWEADLQKGILEVRDQSRLLRLRFKVEEASSTGRYERRWHGRITAPGMPEQRVELGVRGGGCEDLSGIWYGLEAFMTLNDDTYRGCARYGDWTKEALAGHYLSELVTDKGMVRSVELTLTSDGLASLRDEYQERGVTERSGRWRLMPSGKLMLHLLQRDGRNEQHLRLFSRRLDGTLVLEGEGPEFEPYGLRLAPADNVGEGVGAAVGASVGAAPRRE